MHGRVADPDAPDLGVREAGEQLLRGRQGVVRYLKRAGVHVEGHDPATAAGLDLGAHLLLVKCGAAAGVLVLAVAGMRRRHGDSSGERTA